MKHSTEYDNFTSQVDRVLSVSLGRASPAPVKSTFAPGRGSPKRFVIRPQTVAALDSWARDIGRAWGKTEDSANRAARLEMAVIAGCPLG